MRKSLALGLTICSMLLILLLCISGRILYIKLYQQTYADIAGITVQSELKLSENDAALPTVTDEEQILAYADLLGGYTYKAYPHLFKPGEEKLTANRLTVTFDNGSSIGVNADGYVFVNGKLRDLDDGRGQELYHKLYVLFYPNAL